jgi:hypothetical protein
MRYPVKIGYLNSDQKEKDYITDLKILNCKIGNGSLEENGVVRTVHEKTLEVFLDGSWHEVSSNITIGKSIEYIPVGYKRKLDISTGSSVDNFGLNGIPITNKYRTVVGAFGYPSQVGGRRI